VGHEGPEDLVVLCRDCHEIADEERKEEQEAEWMEERLEKAFHTYCVKKYGYVLEVYRREFDRWYARKNR
jgi:hypothetical protein